MMGPPRDIDARERMAERDRSAPGRYELEARRGRRQWEPGPRLPLVSAAASVAAHGWHVAMRIIQVPGEVIHRFFVWLSPRRPEAAAFEESTVTVKPRS